ncbi:MAG: ABC transporter ATP-binding protein [Thermodesulfobacteriota bacterium]
MRFLEVSNLNVFYGDMPAVREASFAVQEREIVTLVGANGAGKSTLLNTISGLNPVQSGEVSFRGQRIDRLPSNKIVALGIVQVPEGRRVFPFMSVRENLLVGSHSKEAKKKRPQLTQWIYGTLPVLKERQNQMAGSLSGGEQQMLAIGRGLMADPKLLMLDEPSLGLAPLLVKQIFHIIEQIKKQEVTILLVEQNVTRALSIANKGYVVENGTIALEGTGEELLANEYLKKAYLGM